MRNYKVTLSHIVGYYNDEDNTPRLKLTEVIIHAESEEEAIRRATIEDKTDWSVYESYAEELED